MIIVIYLHNVIFRCTQYLFAKTDHCVFESAIHCVQTAEQKVSRVQIVKQNVWNVVYLYI